MSLLSLDEIEREVKRRAEVIGATGNMLPTYGHSDDLARPHIEVNEAGYHYVIVEKGQELSRVTTPDLDELLYHVFRHVTHELAGRYEQGHRVKEQDFRRVMFQRQIDLLALLSPQWASQETLEHDQILQQSPYDDASDARSRLYTELRAKGYDAAAAWALSCEQIPLPTPSTGTLHWRSGLSL
jgi:hypothetical protein